VQRERQGNGRDARMPELKRRGKNLSSTRGLTGQAQLGNLRTHTRPDEDIQAADS